MYYRQKYSGKIFLIVKVWEKYYDVYLENDCKIGISEGILNELYELVG